MREHGGHVDHSGLPTPARSAIAGVRHPDRPRRDPALEGAGGHDRELHEFDGESYRISLTYDAPDRAGKSSAHTDTYRGRFAELVPDEKIVEIDEFETSDPDLAGAMTITITLTDAGGGTDLDAVHEGLPAASRRRTTSSAGGSRWPGSPTSSRRG